MYITLLYLQTQGPDRKNTHNILQEGYTQTKIHTDILATTLLQTGNIPNIHTNIHIVHTYAQQLKQVQMCVLVFSEFGGISGITKCRVG